MPLNDLNIRELSTLIERFAANTAGALTKMNEDIFTICAMVIQNRLAVDMLLSTEAGVHHVIKV